MSDMTRPLHGDSSTQDRIITPSGASRVSESSSNEESNDALQSLPSSSSESCVDAGMTKQTGAECISAAFRNRKALITFITGGDPDVETTEQLIYTLVDAGVDIIEIGIPFSDPIAEGPVIQAASARALANGCTVDKLFEMVRRVRAHPSMPVGIPILFMTYVNPIFVYGKDRFLQRCVECSIDGVIVPDLPFEERDELADACQSYDICLIHLIAPTSSSRAEMIAQESEGFIYCVSSLGVTGVRSEIDVGIGTLVSQARAVTDTPCAIGFGISTPEQAREMALISDGVIIGSAIVKIIAQHGVDCLEPVSEYVSRVSGELRALVSSD